MSTSDPILKSGSLYRPNQHSLIAWRRRHFTLTPTHLRYHKSVLDPLPAELIDLSYYAACEIDLSCRRPFAFRLEPRDERNQKQWVLCAETREELEDWMRKIIPCLGARNIIDVVLDRMSLSSYNPLSPIGRESEESGGKEEGEDASSGESCIPPSPSSSSSLSTLSSAKIAPPRRIQPDPSRHSRHVVSAGSPSSLASPPLSPIPCSLLAVNTERYSLDSRLSQCGEMSIQRPDLMPNPSFSSTPSTSITTPPSSLASRRSLWLPPVIDRDPQHSSNDSESVKVPTTPPPIGSPPLTSSKRSRRLSLAIMFGISSVTPSFNF
ncbi:uncharacterized protein VTP21DRAFT_7930 [Calcarisporiella thermophila]|uniref:uncharacterized protein n=1 Tax=Calcarisporiella thermophila TaxID=911321 RepID=UPI003744532A